MPTACLYIRHSSQHASTACLRHASDANDMPDMPTMILSLRMARPFYKLGGWLAHLTNETILYAQADGQQMWPTCVV